MTRAEHRRQTNLNPYRASGTESRPAGTHRSRPPIFETIAPAGV